MDQCELLFCANLLADFIGKAAKFDAIKPEEGILLDNAVTEFTKQPLEKISKKSLSMAHNAIGVILVKNEEYNLTPEMIETLQELQQQLIEARTSSA